MSGKKHKKNYFSGLKQFLDGSLLTREYFIKQMPYIAFLTILSLVYITNHYRVERSLKDIQKLEKEIKELKAESITITSKMLDTRRESEVYQLVNNNGIELQKPDKPPVKIEIKTDK